MAETKLPADIFDVEIKNHSLLKLAYDAYLANSRMDNAKTLKRGEVRGGGKKPWRQKGTGRARFGSSRNPIWRGGGVAFGPTGEQNHSIKLSKQNKRVAICQALTLAQKDKIVTTIDKFAVSDGKTKEAMKFLSDNKVKENENVLLVVEEKTDLIRRATHNLPNVIVSLPLYLNVFDILNADRIMITKKSLEAIKDWLGTEDK